MNSNKQTEKKAECQKCPYKWKTKSKMFYVKCPNCGNRVDIREAEEVDNE